MTWLIHLIYNLPLAINQLHKTISSTYILSKLYTQHVPYHTYKHIRLQIFSFQGYCKTFQRLLNSAVLNDVVKHIVCHIYSVQCTVDIHRGNCKNVLCPKEVLIFVPTLQPLSHSTLVKKIKCPWAD